MAPLMSKGDATDGFPDVAKHASPFPATLSVRIRDQFENLDADPVAGSRLYLDNAGGSLALGQSVEAGRQAAARPDNAGRDNDASRHVEATIERGRRDAALFLGAASGQVIAGESTTANVFRVVDAALAGRSGGNVVTTQLEHPCTASAAAYHAGRFGLTRRVVPIAPGTGEISPATVADHVDGDTAAVVFIHASNVLGTRVDAKAVAAAVHGRNPETLVLVDGTQHAPHGLIDVESMGIDAYFFAPYKTFSVPGGAFAWLSDRMAAKEHPRLEGAGLERWEMGTRDPSGFAAWSAVTDYLAWLGAEAGEKAEDRRTRVVAAMRAIEAHEAVLAEQVIAGLRELQGTHLHGVPVADARREAVFAVSVEGKAAAEVVAALGRQGIVTHHRVHDLYSAVVLDAIGAPDCVRISPAHYNTPEEMERLLKALAMAGS